jgi:hypothetical protein
LEAWPPKIQFIINRQVNGDKVLEAGNSNWDLTQKIGAREVEVDDIREPLKTRSWEQGSTKVIECKAEVPERGEVEQRRIKTTARQVELTEVKRNDSSEGHVTGNALQVVAVGDMPKSPSSQYSLKAQEDIDPRGIRVTNGPSPLVRPIYTREGLGGRHNL